MKTKLFLLALITGGLSMSAQVFIDDSFIYSKGTHIFVKQDINITTDGAFYLRDEAQLIQEDNVDNEGEGFLSVFQEGTQNEFTYNYWSAPVGLATATAGNLGFDMDAQTYFPRLMAGFGANTFDPATTAANLSTNLVIEAQQAVVTAVGNPTGLTDLQNDTAPFAVTQPLTISGRWLYEYNNNGAGGGSYGNWQPINTASNPTVSAGYGFSMKGVTQSGSANARNLVPNAFSGFNGQRYDFRGRPNNGDIPVTVSTDDVALVGNPYPSALDLKRFIDDNTDVALVSSVWTLDPLTSAMKPEILFWESISTSHLLVQYVGGYGSYVPNGFATSSGNYTTNGTYTPAVYSRYNDSGVAVGAAGGSNPLSSLGANRRYAPIGQGFMITRPESDGFDVSTTGNVTFSNDQRLFYKESDGNLSFFANAPGGNTSSAVSYYQGELPKIRFGIAVNDLYIRELVLQFDPTVTMNYDVSWEASIDANKQVNDVYMPVGGESLIINSIPFSTDKVVPVTFDMASASTYEFSIKELENFDTPLIYLEDTATGMVYDLKTGTATLQLPAGIVENRFQVVFQDPSTLSNGDIAIEDRFNVVQNNNAGQLTIFNPSQKEVANVALYDLGGKLIFDQKENNNDSQYTYNTDQLSTGIYIVRISTVDSEQVAVKVSVSN